MFNSIKNKTIEFESMIKETFRLTHKSLDLMAAILEEHEEKIKALEIKLKDVEVELSAQICLVEILDRKSSYTP